VLHRLPASRRLTPARRICVYVRLSPPGTLAKKGVRVAVMHTHPCTERGGKPHRGRAGPHTQNPQPRPICRNRAVRCRGGYKARLESAPCSLSSSRCIQLLAKSDPRAEANHSPSAGPGGAPVPALPTAAFPAPSSASAPIHRHRGAEPDDTVWSKYIFLSYKTTDQDIWLLLPEAWGVINPPYLTFLITSPFKYLSLSQLQYF